MLRSLKPLENFTVTASNGEVANVVDFLFDDEAWKVKKIVMETRGLIKGGRILVASPKALANINWAGRLFHLALTREDVDRVPGVDLDVPIPASGPTEGHRFFGYDYYLGHDEIWSSDADNGLFADGHWAEAPLRLYGGKGEAHLRSIKAIRGYHLQARDGPIGHLEDLLIDDQSWDVRFMAVDTRQWGPGHRVLVAPDHARVSWREKKIFVDLPQEVVRESPPWDPSIEVDRDYEARLHAHYSRPVHWDEPATSQSPAPPNRAPERSSAKAGSDPGQNQPR